MIPDRLLPVFEEVKPLAELFSGSHKRLFLVGGVVRDLFDPDCNTNPADADFDLTTDALPDEIESIASKWADSIWLAGKRFGTIAFQKGGRKYEVTTHRAEAYTSDSRKPFVRFSTQVEEDLSRRDFTINSMAIEVTHDPKLIDPFGGLDDFFARILRTPGTPQTSFGDDPLRMLRAARFLARFSMQLAPGVTEAVKSLAQRLSIVSPERVRDEFDRLLVLDDPSQGLWFLLDTGLVDQFIPELSALKLEQDPIHRHKDVLAHTVAVIAKTAPEKVLRLAALFHDVGKPKTRRIGPDGVSFHFHDVEGAKMTRRRMTALHYSGSDIDDVSRLVELHLRFHTYQAGWTDRAVRRYVRDAGPLLESLNNLTLADCTTRNESKVRGLERRMAELEDRISDLRTREELDSIRPELDGTEVMAFLGMAPSRLVGEALDFLLELRLEEGPLGKDEAKERLYQWWTSKPHPQPGPRSDGVKD